jgi:hypothetical protein
MSIDMIWSDEYYLKGSLLPVRYVLLMTCNSVASISIRWVGAMRYQHGKSSVVP